MNELKALDQTIYKLRSYIDLLENLDFFAEEDDEPDMVMLSWLPTTNQNKLHLVQMCAVLTRYQILFQLGFILSTSALYLIKRFVPVDIPSLIANSYLLFCFVGFAVFFVIKYRRFSSEEDSYFESFEKYAQCKLDSSLLSIAVYKALLDEELLAERYLDSCCQKRNELTNSEALTLTNAEKLSCRQEIEKLEKPIIDALLSDEESSTRINAIDSVRALYFSCFQILEFKS